MQIAFDLSYGNVNQTNSERIVSRLWICNVRSRATTLSKINQKIYHRSSRFQEPINSSWQFKCWLESQRCSSPILSATKRAARQNIAFHWMRAGGRSCYSSWLKMLWMASVNQLQYRNLSWCTGQKSFSRIARIADYSSERSPGFRLRNNETAIPMQRIPDTVLSDRHHTRRHG